MIYLTGAGGAFRVIVLDTRDIDNLKSPHPWMAPDRSALVAFTPDPDWLLSRIRMGPGTPQDIARAIDEAARRPQAELAVTPILGANGQPIKLIPVPAEPTEAKPSVLTEAQALIGSLLSLADDGRMTADFRAEVTRVCTRINHAIAGGA